MSRFNMDYPPLGDHASNKSPESTDTSTTPITDLEGHLRGLIVKNGISVRSEDTIGQRDQARNVPPHLRWQFPDTSQQDHRSASDNDNMAANEAPAEAPLNSEFVEREIALAHQAEERHPNDNSIRLRKIPTSMQQSYVSQNGNDYRPMGSTPNRGFRNPTQAERKRGINNQVDFASTSTSEAPRAPGAPRNQSWLEASSSRTYSIQPKVTQQNLAVLTANSHSGPPGVPFNTSQRPPNYQNRPSPQSRQPFSTQVNLQNGVVHSQHHQENPLQALDRRRPPGADYSYQQPILDRPPQSQNRQLYNPHRAFSFANRDVNQTVHVQSDFLTRVVKETVYRVDMPREESLEKENLRHSLQKKIREAIAIHEAPRGIGFDVKQVHLKCFGSLASGFATSGSDMDLILVSAQSVPDPGSTESEIPRLLEKALLDLGYGARLLTRTRIPIIKFCEKPTPELMKSLVNERKKWETEKAKTREEKLKATSRSKSSKTVAKRMAKKAAKKVENSKAQAIETEKSMPCLPTKANTTGEPGAEGDELQDLDLNLEDAIEPINRNGTGDKGRARKEIHSPDKAGQSSPKTSDQTPPEKKLVLRTDEELVRLYQLAMYEGWFSPDERQIIHRFFRVVSIPVMHQIETDLVEARSALQSLPDVLSRYRDFTRDSHLEYPKSGVGILCDINFSNHLALHNTQLLRCYNMCDSRIRPMVLFVKSWAKARKINNSYQGTLCSYGYVLMVLHYVMNIADPPLAPNLQHIWKHSPNLARLSGEQTCQGRDIRFWRSAEEIKLAARRGMLTHSANRQSLGALLRGFFQYYAINAPGFPFKGFEWTQSVISIRSEGGIMSKQEKDWTGAKTITIEAKTSGEEAREVKHRYLLAIEDPFETDHNVGRTVIHNGIVAIRDEFRRAWSIIQSAGYWQGRLVELCEPLKEREQPKTYFGPNPARIANYSNRKTFIGPQNLAEHLRNGQNGKKEQVEVPSATQKEREIDVVQGQGLGTMTVDHAKAQGDPHNQKNNLQRIEAADPESGDHFAIKGSVEESAGPSGPETDSMVLSTKDHVAVKGPFLERASIKKFDPLAEARFATRESSMRNAKFAISNPMIGLPPDATTSAAEQGSFPLFLREDLMG